MDSNMKGIGSKDKRQKKKEEMDLQLSRVVGVVSFNLISARKEKDKMRKGESCEGGMKGR